MFDLELFMKELKELYKEAPEQIEEYLLAGIKDAKKAKSGFSLLAIRNQLMTYYREIGDFEQCEICAIMCLNIAEELNVVSGENYAIILDNVALSFKAMGEDDVAEKYYKEAEEVRSKL